MASTREEALEQLVFCLDVVVTSYVHGLPVPEHILDRITALRAQINPTHKENHL